MKQSLILAATLAVAPLAQASDHPLSLSNPAFEQPMNLTVFGAYQTTNQNNTLHILEPYTQLVEIKTHNIILAMAYDLVNCSTNSLTPNEIYFYNQIETNTPNFLNSTSLYLRNEVGATATGTNLVEGVVIRKGTNVIDVTRFFPDLFITNGLESIATNAVEQVQTSRTGSSLNLQGLRLLSFQSTNMAFSLTGFATANSSKPAQIGTNFLHTISLTGFGDFTLNQGFVVSNQTILYTNITLSSNLAFITNVVATNFYVSNVVGLAHGTVSVGGPAFKK